jgi:hypothetical protein
VAAAALFREASLGPDVTRLMSDAFNRACRSLHDTGQPELIKEIIAKRIIDAARRGIRDPRQMCEDALRSLGFDSNCD